MNGVYLTRNSGSSLAEVYPDYVGICKFHGCIVWGAAWCKDGATRLLTKRGRKMAELLWDWECRKRFGFYPRAGTAWHVKGKKRTKVDIDFTN